MKYVLFFVKSRFVDATYSEIYGDEDVLLYKELKNSFFNNIRNIHTSMKMNKYFTLPFQGIWKHTFFEENLLNNDDNCIFIFDEGNKQAYNKKYLLYLKRKYKNAMLCFLYWNPADYLKNKYIDFVDDNFDVILSFDPVDCRKHGWIHYSGIYSKTDECDDFSEPNNDIFFVGHNKGRLEKLRALYTKLMKSGLKCDFYISEVDAKDCLEDGIHYNELLSYNEVINHVKNSKSILEVLQDGQHGSTLRPMEAMVYNRALVTNNKNVKNERYFSENQFYVFDEVRNIEPHKIKEMCDMLNTFIYDGKLSPRCFLDFLNDIYNSRKIAVTEKNGSQKVSNNKA